MIMEDSAAGGTRVGAGSTRAPPIAERSLQGHYAGIASRFAAYVADLGTTTAVFTAVLAAASFAVSVVTSHSVSWDKSNTAVAFAFVGWQFAYYAYSWAASGKTLGMALIGVRVVRQGGAPAGVRHAVVRTLAFPLSFLLFGLGFAGILVGSERRALHDVIAGTVVVYAWDARAARLRFLARGGRADGLEPQPPGPSSLPGGATRRGRGKDET